MYNVTYKVKLYFCTNIIYANRAGKEVCGVLGTAP